MSPGVDRDSSPTWSPDGKRLAFIRRPGLPFGIQVQQQAGGPGAAGRFPPQERPEGFPPARPGGGGEGVQNQPAPVRGLTQATFKGGYTISFWAADVKTGEGKEFWHN